MTYGEGKHYKETRTYNLIYKLEIANPSLSVALMNRSNLLLCEQWTHYIY